jgi:hypothetical protein
VAQQVPSTDYLVVKPEAEAGDVREALAELGEVEPVDGSDLLLLRPEAGASGLAAARKRLLDETEGVAWAEPVLLDERNEPHLPTGEVSVRFTKSLSDEDLEAFAREHELRLERRNEFVPEQATFAPADPRRSSLPDLVQELTAAPGVRTAWANTISRYRRVG